MFTKHFLETLMTLTQLFGEHQMLTAMAPGSISPGYFEIQKSTVKELVNKQQIFLF